MGIDTSALLEDEPRVVGGRPGKPSDRARAWSEFDSPVFLQMSKAQTYTQCKMIKSARPGGVFVHTAWIPSKFAKRGKYVELKLEGEWVNGWQVEEVGRTMDAKYVEESERDYARQRDASDI